VFRRFVLRAGLVALLYSTIPVFMAHRHVDHGEPAGRAVRKILGRNLSGWRCSAGCGGSLSRSPRITNRETMLSRANRVESHPLADHWYLVRHPGPFFQNDFAGRIAPTA